MVYCYMFQLYKNTAEKIRVQFFSMYIPFKAFLRDKKTQPCVSLVTVPRIDQL